MRFQTSVLPPENRAHSFPHRLRWHSLSSSAAGRWPPRLANLRLQFLPRDTSLRSVLMRFSIPEHSPANRKLRARPTLPCSVAAHGSVSLRATSKMRRRARQYLPYGREAEAARSSQPATGKTDPREIFHCVSRPASSRAYRSRQESAPSNPSPQRDRQFQTPAASPPFGQSSRRTVLLSQVAVAANRFPARAKSVSAGSQCAAAIRPARILLPGNPQLPSEV